MSNAQKNLIHLVSKEMDCIVLLSKILKGVMDIDDDVNIAIEEPTEEDLILLSMHKVIIQFKTTLAKNLSAFKTDVNTLAVCGLSVQDNASSKSFH